MGVCQEHEDGAIALLPAGLNKPGELLRLRRYTSGVQDEDHIRGGDDVRVG
ncbi:MAG: hypothetical protein BWY93_00872 [Euryarchaeota archaeon ADurb.BinA087]|nr:MAG: hypothetical protein BWY93_00872 [Euryarchaeota archaeon ADurb.BinA087]